MDASTFDALFDTFTHTTFRLEALQAYDVPDDDESLVAFRKGTPRPERSVRTSPWMARIATSTASGKVWSRVHLIRHPLTEYLRYELVAYIESQAAGEQIGLVDLDDHPELVDIGPDFWLFDEVTDHARAVFMHYTDGGQVLDRELIVEPDAISRLAEIKRTVLAMAVPLNTYLAGAND